MSIQKLISQHGVVPQDDFRTFVEAFPEGVKVDEGPLPRWNAVADTAPDDDAFVPIDGVRRLFGATQLAEFLGGIDDEGDCGFWHARLLPHAYVIGDSSMGDPIVQVARGRYAGTIIHTNHETYYGGFECLAGGGDEDDREEFVEILAEAGIAESLEELTTDQVVEALLLEDLYGGWILATSLTEFYAQLIQHAPAAVPPEEAAPPPASPDNEWTKPWTPDVEAQRQADRKAAMKEYRAAQDAARGLPNEKNLVAEAKNVRKLRLAEAEARATATVGQHEST